MPRPPRLCAVSVDLDEIPNYFAIHGLVAPTEDVAHAVYRLALQRLERFASQCRIPLTFFAVGADVQHGQNAATLRRMVESGHEVANHSLDHRYDLSQLPPEPMRRQIADAIEIIESCVGVRPQGFRAPGYVLTDAMVAVLRELGVGYDSSVFPCPAYYGAKSVAMGMISMRGRSSRSILDHPRVLRAPTRPYLLGHPYTSRGEGPVELPVQVTRGARLPYIGTTLTLAGLRKARWLTRMVVGEPLVNLELHGIDVLDASDGLGALVAHQPDVKIALARKLETLAEVISVLRKAGYGFVRLDEAARDARLFSID